MKSISLEQLLTMLYVLNDTDLPHKLVRKAGA